ncbi:biotin-independent malonate decarboxylase subunit gamma [Vibrio natriegens]|uniref:biotin-independent malonate decarboxylase subunit gamma n=1 Tax=Vibrio natriegens TaxID=691 RepID=UPI003B5AC356
MNKRGDIWMKALAENGQVVTGFSPSVQVVDDQFNGLPVRYINVTQDINNPFPRARNGEVGLLEGWNVAKAVRQVVERDQDSHSKSIIVAVIDVPSQAYGRREEAYGIHLSLAAAANAYAQARKAGHPVLGLIVGKAMSGGFLAHGYQASRLIALDDEQCSVHAMGKASAAKVTLRTVEQLESLAAEHPPMAYDINNYHTLGLLWKLVSVENAQQPSNQDIDHIRSLFSAALEDIQVNGNGWSHRLQGENRQATRYIREQMQQAWVY